MQPTTVLISGGGIAGTSLAYWLARHGFAATVVERAADLRSSGSPVDVRGPAVEVARRMGIMSRLQSAATQVSRLTFVDGGGKRVGGIGMGAFSRGSGQAVELPRGDLASILHEAVRDDVEYLFNDSVRVLEQDGHGVDVAFEHSDSRRFDLVVGADGLHSTVRRLVFGSDPDHVRHLGMYVATVPLEGAADSPHEVLTHNTPGRAVSLHPARGRALVAFMFRRSEVIGFDHRDTQQHKRLLADAFADGAWRIPEFLRRVRTAPDLYFDAVSQVALPRWTRDRIALLGDAASCVSLFGDGSSMAIAGAATLATELAENPSDHSAALSRYETNHRRLTEPKQRHMAAASRFLVPATRTGIYARNALTHLVPTVTVGTRGGSHH